MSFYKEISNKLFDIFYVDDKKYGRQQADGSYKLVKGTITPATIDDMLLNQKSLLTYQELHVVNRAFIKWICIDLDISKKEIVQNDVNIANIKTVKDAADEVCKFLDYKQIPYLLEFSGRRGFHIWVIFDKNTSKENGYKLIEYIIDNVKDKFNQIINADKFPKTPSVSAKTKGVGFGVKLPLSQNKASGKLSFFLKRNAKFDYYENLLSTPNEIFLKEQLEILNSLKTLTIEQIQPFIDEYDLSKGHNKNIISASKTIEVNSFLAQDIKLSSIISNLSKCEHIESILTNYQKGIGGRERSILVGLLNQLKTTDDENFGNNLLMELFSNIQGFDKDKTESNLANLKYYNPITCKSLGKCNSCNSCNKSSPIELIEGVNIIERPRYSINNIDERLFMKLRESLYQYSLKNDEVALYPQISILENLNFFEISKTIKDIFNGNKQTDFKSYKFVRNETNKTRVLYNLDPINNIVSTYFTFIINTIHYTEISNNSYGYKFSQSLNQKNIFENWFANWAKYTRKIENVLFNEEYNNYYLVKIDIKNFYDKIDIQRLKIKLYEEAPFNIREKLNELSNYDKENYKQIINYIIGLSSNTTGNSKQGLPQGPAFARYLAELYLNGLDTLIENYIVENDGRGFYSRFVDDIFIFVETQERANKLYHAINEWLSTNNLEFNTNKTIVINTKDYVNSGEYIKFKDNVKYSINQAYKNKNILSNEEIDKIYSNIESLTEDTKFGLKDNLRFFYYKAQNDVGLNHIKLKLSRKIPFSIDGRGSLYMLFYNDLIRNKADDFWKLIDDIKNISGLSFTHYLNTILLNENLISDKIVYIECLVVKTHSREDISDADKLLIATICLKYNIKIKVNYPFVILNSVLEIPNLKLEIEHWDLFSQRLRQFNNKTLFLNEIDRIIKTNNFTVNFLNELSHYSFYRFTEWKENDSDFNNHEILILYYHCLCFLTLFEISNDYSIVGAAWKLLLQESVTYGEISNKNYDFYWIDKLNDFSFNDFSNESYSLILTDKLGNDLYKINCKNEFLLQYKNVLLILLFAKDKTNEFENYRGKISPLIDNKDSLFYNWVTNQNVQLFPITDDICLKNIALNGLIVLSMSDKIFIKSINTKLDFSKYSYVECNDNANENQEIEYKISHDYLDKHINGKSVIDIVRNLSKIILDHNVFKDQYKINYPVFYLPYYSCHNKPLIPYYSEFNELINIYGCKEPNSIDSYWKNIEYILSKICLTNRIQLVNDDNDFNFELNDLEKRFYPTSKILINSATDKINFISRFVSNEKLLNIKNIFDYQYVWSWTIYDSANELLRVNDNLVNYLKIHFDTFTEDLAYIDILFSINKNTIINQDNLKSFFETIKNSILVFQKEIKSITFDLVYIMNEYIDNLFSSIDTNDVIFNPNDFIILKSNFIKEKAYSPEGVFKDKLSIILNGIEITEDTNTYIYNFYKFEPVNFNELERRFNNNIVFYYMNENSYYFYIPEKEFIKAFSRIELRQIYFSKSSDVSEPGSLRLSKLFPKSLLSNLADKVYDSFPFKTNLEIKLRLHYNNTTDIRNRIITWLSLFNEHSIKGSELGKYMINKEYDIQMLYLSILEILNLHYSIEDQDLIFFKEKLIEYNTNSSYILFPIKNPLDDNNGLNRLINKCEFKERFFDFLKHRNNLYKTDCRSKKLVIVTDISISGNQLNKAFEYYKRQFQSDSEINIYNSEKVFGKSKTPIEERYFIFNNLIESTRFRHNLQNIKTVVFLSPIITNQFKEVVSSTFKNEEIIFETNNPLLNKNDYILNESNIDRRYIDIFEKLISDVNLITDLFKIRAKDYKRNIESNPLNNINVLLRVGSLPLKHILLFSLESKQGNRLLDYVENWSNTPAPAPSIAW